MKNLLRIAIVALTFTACQKDYYLADLQAAEAEIAALTAENNEQKLLIAELQNTINVLTADLDEAKAYILEIENMLAIANDSIQVLNVNIGDLETMVIERDIIIDSLLNLDEVNKNTIEALNIEVANLNEQVENVHTRVTNLTRNVQVLEANPVVIHIDVIREVVRYVEVEVVTVEECTYTASPQPAVNGTPVVNGDPGEWFIELGSVNVRRRSTNVTYNITITTNYIASSSSCPAKASTNEVTSVTTDTLETQIAEFTTVEVPNGSHTSSGKLLRWDGDEDPNFAVGDIFRLTNSGGDIGNAVDYIEIESRNVQVNPGFDNTYRYTYIAYDHHGYTTVGNFNILYRTWDKLTWN